jgi:AcrR family transcriptional regulator
MPTVGRPRAFNRDAALHAAMLLFWQKGFLATSMNDLCDAMGIRSPSLYAAFGSKEGLYVEAVQRYNADADRLIWDRVAEGATAREGIHNALLAAAQVLSGEAGNPSGCLVTMAIVDDGCIDTIAETVKAARLGGLNAFRSGMERAVATGELPDSTDTDRMSRFFLSVIQGMAIQARDGASQEDLIGMADAAMAAWPAA